MAINYFIGWNLKDLEGALREAQEDLVAGKAIIQSQAGDVRSASQVAKSAEGRIRMILRALNLLDPDKYPIAEITPVNTTRATFSDSFDPQLPA